MREPKEEGKTVNKYSPDYIAFSKAAYATNRELIEKWAKDDSSPELAEACKMMLEAIKV